MAIGMTPLIPLDRLVPVPDARLQRFGVNNSELFGKPMVTFGGPSLLANPPGGILAAPQADAAPQAPDRQASPGADQAAAPALAPDYSKWTGTGSWTGAAAPAAGSMVDLKA